MSDDKPDYEKARSRIGRDMSRDKLCDELNKLLVKGRAELEKRKILGKDNPKEKVAGQFAIKSLGIISISEGPIQWCNIKRRDGRNHRTYTLDYVIPDPDINLISCGRPRCMRPAVYEKLRDFRPIKSMTLQTVGEESFITFAR